MLSCSDVAPAAVALAIAGAHEARAWLQARQARRERAAATAAIHRVVDDVAGGHRTNPDQED